MHISPVPPHDFWWGHLKIVGMARRELPRGFHPQQLMCYIGHKYDMPSVFYLDLWPISTPFMMVHDPGVAHQMTQAKVLPKHPINGRVLGPLTGPRSIITAEGGEWKFIRTIINPAFSTQYLYTIPSCCTQTCRCLQGPHLSLRLHWAKSFPFKRLQLA